MAMAPAAVRGKRAKNVKSLPGVAFFMSPSGRQWNQKEDMQQHRPKVSEQKENQRCGITGSKVSETNSKPVPW
ncbi:hypothetical protein SAY87_019996 [Trapa incisa]|uniref:Uncharacterized protein n=1 Tax=Trapa incisa TaxID=236973 RepID=A0AAN7K8T1_9MYRT|nr:hypothetical protein SAY87_019996 [Trapa incisa]